MAGLPLGTLVAGRLTTRIRRPLAWFGATEPGIGGLALLTPWALDLVAQVWIALQDRVSDQPWALTAARFVCSLAVLLAPTMLMGATLPLVVRSSLADRALAGPGVGVLYATNTAGLILTDDRPLVEYHRSLPRGEHDIDTSGLTGDPTRHVTARVPPSTP